MNETISYGVFWKSTVKPDEFRSFLSWCTTYDGAYKIYKEVQENPLCLEVIIVERCEHYEVVATAEAAP